MLQTDWLLYSLSISRYLVSIKVECRTHAPYERVYTRGRGTGGWKKGVGRVGKIEHMKLLT